ncbi:MAG: hypothetical protein KDA75_12410 [Planctomycetaceae bacterium]|nr:hypothetical protein [Planctomycetaceae bacterium]
MEKFSRVLAVAVAVLSVAFMGFAGVVSFGGPNWEAEARSLEGYTFSRSGGENPVWTATRAAGRVELNPKSPLLPEVLTAAIRDRTEEARKDRDRLAQEIPDLQKQSETLRAMQDQDVPALDRYFDTQSKRLADTHAQIATTSQQQEMLAAEVSKIEEQIESRREDVFRLELEYRVLEADVERTHQNVAVVEEQIRLLEDELDKAQRRKQELDQRGIPAVEKQYFPEATKAE